MKASRPISLLLIGIAIALPAAFMYLNKSKGVQGHGRGVPQSISTVPEADDHRNNVANATKVPEGAGPSGPMISEDTLDLLPPELHPLIRSDALLGRMHATVAREPRDEAWASAVEYRWNDAFLNNLELLAHGTPTVHCRTTQCQILLVTNSRSSLTRTEWSNLLSKGAERPEWEKTYPLVHSLTTHATTSAEIDGRTVVMLFIGFLREPIDEDQLPWAAPPN